MIRALAAFAAGVLFALGLGVSGMTDGAAVVGFLDVLGGWQPALVFVMVGGIGTHAVARAAMLRRAGRPALTAAWTWGEVDLRTIAGAALFGVGWALGGYCPGPAVVGLASGAWEPVLFVASMAAGMGLHALAPASEAATSCAAPDDALRAT